MAVVLCPLCESRVNAQALHCPTCGADPRLSADEARADLRARGVALPGPQERRSVSRRRRFFLAFVMVLVAVILVAPLWIGYFGPEVATYARVWRPWRTEITVTSLGEAAPGAGDPVEMEVRYRDPWPGEAGTPGRQVVFYTVERPSPWLPWMVTRTYIGP